MVKISKKRKLLIASGIILLTTVVAGVLWFMLEPTSKYMNLSDEPLNGPGKVVGPCDSYKSCYEAINDVLPELQTVADERRGKASEPSGTHGNLLIGKYISNLDAFQSKGWFTDTGSDSYPSIIHRNDRSDKFPAWQHVSEIVSDRH